MNHVYRIVWNCATACYQAVTESAKGQGKTIKSAKTRKSINQSINQSINPLCTPASATALGVALFILGLPAFAGPEGGQVTAGSATIKQIGNATTINQSSNKAAIDWSRFSVGANESVRFNPFRYTQLRQNPSKKNLKENDGLGGY